MFLSLLVFAFLTDFCAYFAAIKYHNNMPVYNVSNLVQIFLIALYFNYCIKVFMKRHVGIYIGLLSVIVGILNIAFLQPLNIFNSNFFLFQTILVLLFGTLLYVQYLRSAVYFRIQYSPHFWLVMVLVISYAINLLNFSLYDFYTTRMKEHKNWIDISIIYFNCLTNLGFGLVFLLYPKMKLTDD